MAKKQGILTSLLDVVQVYGNQIGLVPKAVFNLRVEILELRGRLRGAEEDTTVLYIGRGGSLAYLKKNIFTDTDVQTSRKSTIFSVLRVMEKLEKNADVVFVDVGWPYSSLFNKGGTYLEMPDWVRMYVPLDGSFADVESRFRKTARRNDLRLIRRNHYTYKTSDDEADIKGFYDDFYLPYITHRHEGEVVQSSRKNVEKIARQGTILQVIGEDGPIVAGLVMPAQDALLFVWTGMKARYVADPPEGANAALNYYCLQYAHEQGFKVVDFMGARSFPKDGVFQFNRRWGAVAHDTFSLGSVLIKPASNNLRAAQFCEGYPAFARRNGRLEMVLCATGPRFDAADCKSLVSNYECKGVDQITVVRVTQDLAEPIPDVSDKYPNVRVIQRNLADFATAFERDFSPD